MPGAYSASACGYVMPGFINFQGIEGELTANCKPFFLKGLNWYGSEGVTGVLEGLHKRSLTFFFDFFRRNDFNALRLPFNHKSVHENRPVDSRKIDHALNPGLVDHEGRGVNYLTSLQHVVLKAAEQRILVVLSANRLSPTDWPGSGLWYSEEVPEETVLATWTKMSDAFCGHWNVIGVDLMHEPHNLATWGTGPQSQRWDLAAARLGNHILARCPRWLIFVEGVAGVADDSDETVEYWWGENLAQASRFPVRLNDMAKLVFSPHIFGPSTDLKPYYLAHSFPNNLIPIWDEHFLDARRSTGVPFVIGELGGGDGSDRLDRLWQEKALSHFPQQHVGLFYYCLNPSSADTGGLFTEDYSTTIEGKLQLLRRVPSTNVDGLHQASIGPYPPPSSPPPIQPPPLPPPPSHPPPWMLVWTPRPPPPRRPRSPSAPSPGLKGSRYALPSLKPLPRPPSSPLRPLSEPMFEHFDLVLLSGVAVGMLMGLVGHLQPWKMFGRRARTPEKMSIMHGRGAPCKRQSSSSNGSDSSRSIVPLPRTSAMMRQDFAGRGRHPSRSKKPGELDAGELTSLTQDI